MGINMISILISQFYDYICIYMYYISFLTFLWYYLWKQYLCLRVIDRNVYNGCTFCCNIGLSPPTQGKRVCRHVCVFGCVCSSACMCVLALCVCVCDSEGVIAIHLSACSSVTVIFFLIFFKLKHCLYLKTDKSRFWTPIWNLLNCWQSVCG